MTNNSSKDSSNKDAARSLLQLAVAGKINEAYEKYVARDMRHHNVSFAGDAASLKKAMQEDHSMHPNKILEIKNVLEDGDLVAVHSHVRLKPNDPGFALVHIFRFENGRVLELWDIAQALPEKSPNKNGAF